MAESSSAATGATGATDATATTAETAEAKTNQSVQSLSESEKTMDISANILLKDFIQFYEKRKEEEFNNEIDKFKTLIITVGAAQHDSPNNQLILLLEMLMPKKTFRDNTKLFLHFDTEWDKPHPRGKNLKRYKNLGNIHNYRQRYLDNNTIEDFFYLTDFDDMDFPAISKVSIPEDRKQFMKRHLSTHWTDMHLFIPYNLVSHYVNYDIYGRRKFAISKKTFAEFGKGCPPVPGSTYDTLNQFIQKEKFDQIIIYNSAYWDSHGVAEYNNKGEIKGAVSFLQNRYFEGMCELLNIVLNAGESVQKYIFETEFYRKLSRNTYTHKHAENIKSIITRQKIGKLYPLNETTRLAGGKRKTRKQKRRRL